MPVEIPHLAQEDEPVGVIRGIEVRKEDKGPKHHGRVFFGSLRKEKRLTKRQVGVGVIVGDVQPGAHVLHGGRGRNLPQPTHERRIPRQNLLGAVGVFILVESEQGSTSL